MLGGFGPLVWALVRSLLTPAALFVLLNLVIGTVVITSNGFRSRHQPKLSRAPSVLDRLRSVGLYRYPSGDAVPLELSSAPTSSHEDEFSTQRDEPPVPTRAPSVLERLLSIGSYPSGDAVALELSSSPPSSHGEESSTQRDEPPVLTRAPSVLERLRSIGLYRYRSGEEPLEHEAQPRFRRNQSEPRAKAEEEEEEEAKPAARVKKSASSKPARTVRAAAAEEEGVDARADDFINRFKQQLRLQRLDSIKNYIEMLNRGK